MTIHSFNGTSPAWAGLHVELGAVIAAVVIAVVGILLVALRGRIAAAVESHRNSNENEASRAYRFQRLARNLLVAGIIVLILGVGYGLTSFAF